MSATPDAFVCDACGQPLDADGRCGDCDADASDVAVRVVAGGRDATGDGAHTEGA